MIISHKYKFIFIKSAKTAGTSLEVFLSQHCGDSDIVTPIIPHVEPHRPRNYRGWWNPLPELFLDSDRTVKSTAWQFLNRKRFYNHIPAQTVRCRVSDEIWDSYYKFCVDRNPWDKVLSHFHMVNDRQGGGLTIDQYLAGNRWEFCYNFPKYTDPQGRLIVDKVIHYESLLEELGSVFAQLGVPFEGSLGVKAKSEHRKDRRPYREVLSTAQADAIQEAFIREIELMGYQF